MGRGEGGRMLLESRRFRLRDRLASLKGTPWGGIREEDRVLVGNINLEKGVEW